MISKVLVANRGEIAVRAFRAAYELGIATVAVFPWEDRNSPHRFKADESYQIGLRGHPVKAYLTVEEVIAAALRSGADSVYPGYGFLSENPELAEGCRAAGLTFVGPPAEVLALVGNKARAISAARDAGLPVLASTQPSSDPTEVVRAAEELSFPVFVKAVAGGGGRGMRRVAAAQELRSAVDLAMREAAAAFGDTRVLVEQAVVSPRHIEVQVLADRTGHVVHLFERDCSVQRRHQKVVEIAPAANLDPEVRKRLCRDAVEFATAVGYENAGTVEFLVDESGRHFFIEMNPRIQVEHTVTEEVTDVDLVRSQLLVAGGSTLRELGLTQDAITIRGSALQCRITAEDPANDFRPDTGRISAYRAPGGAGVRLDGDVLVGTQVEPHFDSLLVKLVCRGADLSSAVARARRALAEFRVRGVSTNLPFLQAVLADPDFQAGHATTSFIEDRPELLRGRPPGDRGTKLLRYLADVTVNQPHGAAQHRVNPTDKLPPLEAELAVVDGSRQRLRAVGPERFAQELRAQDALALTDTTFRDAHQSLLATRVRTKDLLAVAPHVSRLTPQLLSVEAWGGATYDVALRFLHEDPWDRLAVLREAIPNICLQMLLRGRNTVGYTPYPQKVTDVFVQQAAAAGIDIFRVFDALNDVRQMAPAIDAIRSTGSAIAEVALCYTGDLSSPHEDRFTLDYYLRTAEQIVRAGAHVLAVKDMAGLLRPGAAVELVTALRREFELPVHLHTHDTGGGQTATLLAAWEAGVDAVDGASAALAGTTSQPPLSAIVAATDGTARATGLDLASINALEPYWESVRRLYAPFESGLPGPTGRVYRHEIPGGQLSNLRQQAIALGLADRFEHVEEAYAAADRLLGRIVKVTPSSKVVGDLALHLVGTGTDPADFAAAPERYDLPDSLVGLLQGELGEPEGGWPEPFRTRALAGRPERNPVVELAEDDDLQLEKDPRGTLNRLLFPEPTRSLQLHRESFGDTSVLATGEFLYGLVPGEEHVVELEPGVLLLVGVESIGEPDARGFRSVMCTLNGQLRPLSVRDRSVQSRQPVSEKADRNRAGHVAAPFSGVVSLQVEVGQAVQEGQIVATIEAMKMEASISATTSGTVKRLAAGDVQQVEGGDLLLEISP